MTGRRVNRVKTTALIKGMIDAYYEDIRQAPGQGRKVAWTCGPAPFEMFRVMGIAFQHGESFGAYAAARKGAGELKQAAEAEGYSPDACSYWRTINGAALLSLRGHAVRPDMWLPLPDFVVATGTCQTQGLWGDSLGRLLKVPVFVIDVPPPIQYTEPEFLHNIGYVERQLSHCGAFLEAMTGRRLDYDHLKEVMKLVEEAARLRRGCMELSKHIPSPLTFFDHLISLGAMHVLRGTPQSPEYFRRLKAELEERVASSSWAVPGERFRLYWDHLPIWFKLGALSEKLAGYGANIIVGIYTHGSFYYEADMIDVDRPLWSIAAEIVHVVRTMDARFRMNLIEEFVHQYSLDGLVLHSSRTCRPYNLGQHDIVNYLERHLAIPGVLIDGDPTDDNYYSDAQTDTRLRAFVEMMEARGRHGDTGCPGLNCS